MIVLSVHYVSSEVANWCKSNNFCIHLCQKLGDSIRKSIFYVCISDKFINFVALVSIPEAPMGRGWAGIHMAKAFLYALVLTIRESRKFICKSKTKQQRTSHEVYYIHPFVVFGRIDRSLVGRVDYIFTLAWGFPALLVSTYRAMREPTDCGTSDKTWLHVLLPMYKESILLITNLEPLVQEKRKYQ